MPIDRRRRDAIAALLLQHLRGELPAAECYKQIRPILDGSPLRRKLSHKDNPPGFPVLHPAIEPEYVDDSLLEYRFDSELPYHLQNHESGKKQKYSWEFLCRSVALLRSNLTEQDLGYPRRSRTKRFAYPILWLVALASFVGVMAGAIAIHPLFLLLWPALGIFFFWRRRWFILLPVKEDPESSPFLTIAQWKSAASLITPGEIPPFNANLYPHQPRQRTYKLRWMAILLSPLGLLLGLLLLAVLALAGMFVLSCWPVFIPFGANKPTRCNTNTTS